MKHIVTVFDEKNRPSYELRKSEVSSDVIDTNWDEGDKLVDYAFVQTKMNNLLGRVLTIIDASIHGEKSNKAVKDLIKGEFISDYAELSELLHDRAEMQETCTFDESDPEDVERLKKMEELSEDEVLGLTK